MASCQYTLGEGMEGASFRWLIHSMDVHMDALHQMIAALVQNTLAFGKHL